MNPSIELQQWECLRRIIASVYAKKPGCSEGWVSKSTSQSTRKKVRPAFSRIKHLFLSNGDGSFQQNTARAHTSKAAISWLKCNTGRNIQPGDWPPNLLFVSDWKRLEHCGCSCLCQPRASRYWVTFAEIFEINFFEHCAKSHRFDARQTEGKSSETKETLFRTNIQPTQCLKVMLSSCYSAIFGRCNITEYYNCCWAAVCVIFFSNDFIDHTYRTIQSLPFMKFIA